MKKYLILEIVLIVSLINISFYTNAQTNRFFYTKGKEIIATDGKPFLMRGTNLGNWLVPEGYMFQLKNVNSPRLINQALTELIGSAQTRQFWKKYLASYITEADIHYMKLIGMNSVRVPFNYRLFTSEDYLGENNDQHGFELLDKLLTWCRKEKLYVILDMHCAPGGQTGDNIDDGSGYPFLFENEEDQQLTIAIWKRIAQHYRNEPIIIGYDLLNEPIATYFDKEHFNSKLEPLYKRITAAIRQVDKNHILFLGGAQWNSNFEPFGPPFDSKLVYTFHKYWTAPTEKVIQNYIDFRNKYNVPIYCGETGENTDQWIDSFKTTLNNANIGWHFWPYKKMGNTRCVIQFPKPPNYDSLIHYAEITKKNFEDIRKNRPQNINRVKLAIEDFLTNCLFANCVTNEGYVNALDFKANDKQKDLSLLQPQKNISKNYKLANQLKAKRK